MNRAGKIRASSDYSRKQGQQCGTTREDFHSRPLPQFLELNSLMAHAIFTQSYPKSRIPGLGTSGASINAPTPHECDGRNCKKVLLGLLPALVQARPVQVLLAKPELHLCFDGLNRTLQRWLRNDNNRLRNRSEPDPKLAQVQNGPRRKKAGTSRSVCSGSGWCSKGVPLQLPEWPARFFRRRQAPSS